MICDHSWLRVEESGTGWGEPPGELKWEGHTSKTKARDTECSWPGTGVKWEGLGEGLQGPWSVLDFACGNLRHLLPEAQRLVSNVSLPLTLDGKHKGGPSPMVDPFSWHPKSLQHAHTWVYPLPAFIHTTNALNRLPLDLRECPPTKKTTWPWSGLRVVWVGNPGSQLPRAQLRRAQASVGTSWKLLGSEVSEKGLNQKRPERALWITGLGQRPLPRLKGHRAKAKRQSPVHRCLCNNISQTSGHSLFVDYKISLVGYAVASEKEKEK